MANITLYNTLSKKLESFQPLDHNLVKMYVCGPTVYDFAHIGNARSVVIYDVLFRLLKHTYGDVLYARNITDVDDKIIASAMSATKTIGEINTTYYGAFISDMDSLNCLRPTVEPKVTDNIEEIISMIKTIILNNHGYVVDGHVYFETSTYEDYGKLSSKNLDTLIHGERVTQDLNKRNSNDFVLWKPASADDYAVGCYWDSPWGNGRPGWHIECSAMSCKHLGPEFDIHGGGSDLKFPHHENEIAQSWAANPESRFAIYWVHNGFVTVNGEKMSKSLKNTITIRNLIKNKIDGNSIRYALLKTHYRKPLDWTTHAIESAQSSMEGFQKALEHIDLPTKLDASCIDQAFMDAISQDLNTPAALTELHNLSKLVKTEANEQIKQEIAIKLLASANFIGLDIKQHTTNKSESLIQELILARTKARENKNYAEADKIRKQLTALGVTVQDKH